MAESTQYDLQKGYMPYFAQYNALFIHIPKNAGRSIEKMLLPGGVKPDSGRRRFLNRAFHLVQQKTSRTEPRDYLLGTLDVSLVAQHLTLQEIALLNLVDSRTREASFKFCVVRSPFIRVISSLIHFRDRFFADCLDVRPTNPAEFEKALVRWIEIETTDHNVLAHRRPQNEYVRDTHGRNAMDLIIRMERLDEGVATLSEQIGVGARELPWVGKAQKDPNNYASLYTPSLQKMVEDAFGDDLEMFGYGFSSELDLG